MKFNVMAFVVRDQFGAGTETLEDRRKEVKRKRGWGNLMVMPTWNLFTFLLQGLQANICMPQLSTLCYKGHFTTFKTKNQNFAMTFTLEQR
jgi:hypothetical protein